MCSLSTFRQPPPRGYATICERNSELIAAKVGDTEYTRHYQNLDYPEIDISHDLLRPSMSRESARSAFLEHEDTLRKRLLRAWYEHGITGLLQEVAACNDGPKGQGPGWLSSVASGVLAVVRWTSSLHGSLFPHLAMSNEDLVRTFSKNPDWHESAVRCFAWHPHTTKFALALRDDSIKVYTAAKTGIIPVLKHKLQKGVAEMAWKPCSASVLAVACQSCVLIWHVDPTSLATRPSTGSVQVLSRQGHSPVTSLAWDPQGGVLLSGSPTDTAIMVWDVARETCDPLRRVGGGGVTALAWSPDGSKVFSACPAPILRVWETQTWTCERWAKLSGRCQAGCWSQDGTTLLFSTAEEPIIYSLTFNQGIDETRPVVGGSKVAVSAVNLAEVEIENEDEKIRVGGTVQCLAWDPTGERLAVQFTESRDVVALFQTKLHPVLEIMPCGFIRGDTGDEAQLINFQPKFDQGALMTVVWSSGRVSFVPLYFLPSLVVEQQKVLNNPYYNGNTQRTTLFTEHLDQ